MFHKLLNFQVRARQFYKAGYKTITSIANATPQELMQNISHLPRQTAVQIIAAANVMNNNNNDEKLLNFPII